MQVEPFSDTISYYFFVCMRLAASCVQSRQLRAKPPVACKQSTVREQLFELKNEDAIKKSENLRDTCAC
jgi:hypothetical protein